MSAHPFAAGAAVSLTSRADDSAVRVSDRALALDVLVVEDDAAARAGVVQAVRSLGHVCRSAADGQHAWRMLQEQSADVVISDWEMPGLNGAELCQRIRQQENGHYTYFILMTGFHDRAHLLAGMAAGADDYQKKPIDLDELEARLVSAARVVALHRRLAERAERLRRDSSQLWNTSRTDALTGVGNRLRMHEELDAAWARAQRYGHRFSIGIVDVDDFKKLNDGLGHLAGDHALTEIATAIKRQIRTADSVFRYGGEEFVVLLPEQALADAARAMDRIREEVERRALLRPEPGRVLTVSCGVAELAIGHDTSIEDCLARADAALYLAKEHGKNRVEQIPLDRLLHEA